MHQLQAVVLIVLGISTSYVKCNKSTRINLSCAQIRAFVNGHNFRRWTVAKGLVLGQPAASDMTSMVWDEELAEKAAKWAENGVFAHNPNRTIEEALISWFNEHLNYGFYPFLLGTPKAIGHYTQLVWANSNRLGCGISQKKGNDETFTLFVCNYGPTGNYLGQLPYKASRSPGYLQCKDGQCTKPYGYACSF